MTTPPGRFSELRWLQTTACVIAMLGALLLCVLGLAGFGDSSETWMIAAGGFVFFLAVIILTFVRLILKMESTVNRQHGEIHDLHGTIVEQTAKLDAIVENTRISDAAKSLARRDEELQALRATIRNDVRAERWEAATTLIEEMEHRFHTGVESLVQVVQYRTFVPPG